MDRSPTKDTVLEKLRSLSLTHSPMTEALWLNFPPCEVGISKECDARLALIRGPEQLVFAKLVILIKKINHLPFLRRKVYYLGSIYVLSWKANILQISSMLFPVLWPNTSARIFLIWAVMSGQNQKSCSCRWWWCNVDASFKVALL